MFLDINNYINIEDFLGRSIDAKTVLPIGDGFKPMLLAIFFSFIYLLIGETKRIKPIRNIKLEYFLKWNSLTKFIYPVFFISIIYTIIRYFVTPDFPLFAVVAGDNLRDIAFRYGSNTSIPWVFLPSINSQVYRILIPFIFFFLLYVTKSTKKVNYFLSLMLLCSGIAAIVLNFGTFKRTPILYLLLWWWIYYSGYQKIKLSNSLRNFLIIFGLLLLITTYYGTNASDALQNLMARFFIGEAIGEFLAIEHFGSTFEYRYFDIPLVYLQKIAGQDVMTFSQEWKVLVGGSRGYTSIGVIAEMFVSFGWWSILLFAPFTLLVLKIDTILKKYRESSYWPVLSGIIVVISFMMVKGFFAQLFTGGVLTLTLVFLWQRKILNL